MTTAIEARDEALARVLRNAPEDWPSRALSVIPVIFERDALVTGEDVRLALIPVVGKPHHHNAWGALVRSAYSRDVLRATSNFTHMRTTKSHGRMTRVYRVTGKEPVLL